MRHYKRRNRVEKPFSCAWDPPGSSFNGRMGETGFRADRKGLFEGYIPDCYKKGLNGLSGSVPFSLFEAVLCVLLLFILAALGVLAWRAAHRRTEQVRWRNAALRSLSLIMVFVILFNLLWGFNYYRLRFSRQMGATVEKTLVPRPIAALRKPHQRGECPVRIRESWFRRSDGA